MRFLLFLLTASVLAAQGALTSLANKQVLFVIESGTGSLASEGIGVRVFAGSGRFHATLGIGVDPAVTGTYTYTRLSSLSGRIEMQESGGLSYQSVLTFTNSELGTFVNTAGTSTQTGYFFISDAPRPAFVNLATRAVLRDGEVLTPGFWVGGTAPRRVLIRAVGPGLTQWNVPGVMPAPVLKVYSGETEIAMNAGWGGTKELADAFAATFAFGLPADSKDSALLLTLNPGGYSARVSGTPGGDVLVEVYFVD